LKHWGRRLRREGALIKRQLRPLGKKGQSIKKNSYILLIFIYQSNPLAVCLMFCFWSLRQSRIHLRYGNGLFHPPPEVRPRPRPLYPCRQPRPRLINPSMDDIGRLQIVWTWSHWKWRQSYVEFQRSSANQKHFAFVL